MSGALKSSAASARFPTTHWTSVLVAASGHPADAGPAFDRLCRAYWYPLYSFVRRQGHDHHGAEDLTQEFMARLATKNSLAQACAARGRFRTFLLTALRNFLINDWHRGQAAKRGGGRPNFSLHLTAGEEAFQREMVDPSLTPEQAFERNWALATIEQALAAVRADYASTGRGELFAALAPGMWGGGPPEPQAQQAERLGLSVTALKVAAHRLRRRLRAELEAQVRATVDAPEEVEEELRHLLAALGHARRL